MPPKEKVNKMEAVQQEVKNAPMRYTKKTIEEKKARYEALNKKKELTLKEVTEKETI